MANSFSAQVVAYIVCFIVTNIDEFVILVSFMLEVLSNTGMTQKHVWLGTMIACTAIMALSLVGLASQAIPTSYLVYVNILGIVPIIVGGINLYKTYYKEWWLGETDEETPQVETTAQNAPPAEAKQGPQEQPAQTNAKQPPMLSKSTSKRDVGSQLIRKMSSRLIILHQLNNNIDVRVEKATETCPEHVVLDFKVDNGQGDIETGQKPAETAPKQKTCGQKFIEWLNTHKQIATVVSMTLANSGDNVAVYLPMISSSSVEEVIVWIILFYGGIVTLTILARLLVNCQGIRDTLEKYGKFIIPWPLIGIGAYILAPFVAYLISL